MDNISDEYLLNEDHSMFFKFLHVGGGDTIEKTLGKHKTTLGGLIKTKDSVFSDDEDEPDELVEEYGGDEYFIQEENDIDVFIDDLNAEGMGEDLNFSAYEFEIDTYTGGGSCCVDECICEKNCNCTCVCICNTNTIIEPRDSCFKPDYNSYDLVNATIFDIDVKYDIDYKGLYEYKLKGGKLIINDIIEVNELNEKSDDSDEESDNSDDSDDSDEKSNKESDRESDEILHKDSHLDIPIKLNKLISKK